MVKYSVSVLELMALCILSASIGCVICSACSCCIRRNPVIQNNAIAI